MVEVELTGAKGPVVPVVADTPSRVGARPSDVDERALSARVLADLALEHTVYLRGGPVYGAGVLVDRKGHVLTADHVVEGVDTMHATFYGDETRIPVQVVERDTKLDLALLRLAWRPTSRAPARLGSVVDVGMGDEVYAMGAPRKMKFSFSRGIVSYVGRSFGGTLYFQTDLTANSGSSGGPILNDRGELIGVASFILRNSQGLAFAVPIDYALARFDVLTDGRDARAFAAWLAARQPAPDPSDAADGPEAAKASAVVAPTPK